MPDSSSLLLVDAMALAYRAFHAIPPLNAKDGTPTNAILGFIKAIRHLQERFQPAKQAVIFDGGLPAERMELLPSYKAQREEMPDALHRQLPILDEFLDAAGIARIRVQGEEADDVMATLAIQAASDGSRVVLATNDKDLYQVVSNSITMVAPVKDAPVMGIPEVQAKTGVPPAQIPSWLALTGDAVDNIPGVPGVGPKTAARLLKQFGSLERIWAGLDEVSGDKLRDALRASREDVIRNLALVTLNTAIADVPNVESLTVKPGDVRAMRELMLRLNMPSLAPALPVPTQMELL